MGRRPGVFGGGEEMGKRRIAYWGKFSFSFHFSCFFLSACPFPLSPFSVFLNSFPLLILRFFLFLLLSSRDGSCMVDGFWLTLLIHISFNIEFWAFGL